MDPQLIYLAITLCAVGALTGVSAGLFGIGGGAVMVPALYFAFTALGVSPDVVQHCAVATSLAVIVLNAIRSVSSHHRHAAVMWDVLWPKNPLSGYALWIGLGAFAGAAWLAPYLPGHILVMIFAVVAGLIALKFIFEPQDFTLRDSLPSGAAKPVIGTVIGGLSGIMGIGGGSLTVPFMTMCGVKIHKAIGTASGFGLAIALPATLGFIWSGWGVDNRPAGSLGYVNLYGFALIAIVSLFFVPIGTALAHKLDQRKLKRVFGICLLLVALNMARKALL